MSGLPSPNGPASAPLRWLGGAAVAVAGAWVFRGALEQFFSADDFAGLARAAGLLPHLQGLWRYLSGEVYFLLMWPLSGLDPRGYHAASLLLHVACALAVYALLHRALSTPAAFAGAVCFATHPAHFTATYWVSGVGSPMALLLSLGALFAALRRDRARWLAVPLFVAALLAKESVMFLPLALWAVLHWDAGRAGRAAAGGEGPANRRGGTPGRATGGRSYPPRSPARLWRSPLLLALSALSLGQIVYLGVTGVMGPGSGSAPYALGPGKDLVANALTYLGWTADFFFPTMHRFQDAMEPQVFGWGAGLLALWLVGLASPGLRRRGWLVAGAFYLAFLLPVLPLRHHTYHYYLYASLTGLGWCVGATLDLAFERLAMAQRARPAPPPPARPAIGSPGRAAVPWAFALGLAALLSVNGALLVRKIETMPFMDTTLRADPTVDRGRIAAQAIESLRQAGLPDGVRLLFWSPIARSLPGALEAGESYFESNVRTALFDGLAVRLFFPRVDSVGFVLKYAPLPAGYLWAVYRPDGKLRLATSAELDSALMAYRAPLSPAPAGADVVRTGR
jgi:hypothetical protein